MEKLASNHASPCRIVSVHCNRLTVHHQPSNVWYWNDIEKQTQVHSPEGIKENDQCETTRSVREYVWQSHWIFARSKQPMWRKGKSQQTLTQSLSWIFVFGPGGGDGSYAGAPPGDRSNNVSPAVVGDKPVSIRSIIMMTSEIKHLTWRCLSIGQAAAFLEYP